MEMFCLDCSCGDKTTDICLNLENNYFVFFNVAKKGANQKTNFSLFYQMSTPPPKPKERYKTKQNRTKTHLYLLMHPDILRNQDIR